jgi:hypothetical protein
VFVEQAVSITCDLRELPVRWWLTKESGGVGKAHTNVSLVRELRKAYVVVQSSGLRIPGHNGRAVVAQMSVASVQAAWSMAGAVAVSGQAGYRKPGMRVCDSILFTACCGGYSVTENCGCMEGRLCKSCAFLRAGSRRFVDAWQMRYLWPYGSGHWFFGVTDAVFGESCRPAQVSIVNRYRN